MDYYKDSFPERKPSLKKWIGRTEEDLTLRLKPAGLMGVRYATKKAPGRADQPKAKGKGRFDCHGNSASFFVKEESQFEGKTGCSRGDAVRDLGRDALEVREKPRVSKRTKKPYD